MKKLYILVFLLLLFLPAAFAQQLKTVEYFFDTDPGFGKGADITISSNALDSGIVFNIGSLSNGVHTLYTRLKNSNNTWSTLYQSNILITNGIAGTPALTEAEYFFDKDPGFGNGLHISLDNTSLDSNLAFTIDGLSPGQHTVYIRLKDNSNAWSTVYQSSFLVSNGSGSGAQLVQGEYFFDADPGFGKGTQLILNNASLDSSFNFSVSALSPGVHTVYVRLKNNSNNWSFTYQSNFVVSTGTTGAPLVKSLEYFLDADSGVNRNTLISLVDTVSLDTTLSIPVTDNGADQRVLGVRVASQTGQVSNVALSAISLCDLYKPQGGFRMAQYGGTFTLIDTTRFNTSHAIKWLANNSVFDSSYTTNYQFPAGTVPGSTVISELTGTGCRVDTVQKTLNIPGVESIAPFVGSYNSDFNLNVYGAGLDTNLNVYMQKGDTVIYPYLRIAGDGNQHLIAVFDFHNYAKTYGFPEIRENYTVHVKYNNGYEFVSDPASPVSMEKQGNNTTYICAWPVLPIGQRCPVNELIRVPDPYYQSQDSVPEPYFATDLSGPSSLRTGLWNKFTMSITNTGTVVAKGIPFYIMVPASFDIDTTIWNLYTKYPGMRDSISIITPIDTIINGRHLQYKLIAMIYGVLAPGETGYFPLRLRTNSLSAYHIFYTAQSRMFGSPMTDHFGPCWGAAIDFAIGFVPGLSCVYAFGNLVNDGVNAYYHDPSAPSNWFSWTLSVGGTLVSCIPGGGPLGQVAKASAKEMGFIKAGLGELEDAVNVADKGLNVISNANSVANASDPCSKVKQKPKDKNGSPFASFDPNFIVGNSDYDSVKHYISNYSSQKYTIGFENKPSANASAQHVYITDTLNPDKFYLKTFNIGQFYIGDSVYNLPSFRYQVTKDVALKNRSDMKVRFTARFDTSSGIMQADFFSIDTLGHVLPLDTIAGFLPPDKDGVSGTAGLSYSVYIQSLNTLDTFSNKAFVYFDNNAPVVTNTWINTVDTTAPQTKITKAIRVNDSTAKLVLQLSDIGSGNFYSTLYGKADGDSLFRKLGTAVGDTILFNGGTGHTYQLFVKGLDHVNNEERKDSAPEITYTFQAALPVTLLSFSGNKTADSVKLHWVTSDEINLASYTVEKSADARSFASLANVQAKGDKLTNDYVLYDRHPYAKTNYYRLKEINTDGSFTYSNIVRVDFDKKYTLNISPVPAHDYVVIAGAENFTTIQFIDAKGHLVKQFGKTPGNRFTVSGLKAGVYFIRLSSDTDMQVLKLVKE